MSSSHLIHGRSHLPRSPFIFLFLSLLPPSLSSSSALLSSRPALPLPLPPHQPTNPPPSSPTVAPSLLPAPILPLPSWSGWPIMTSRPVPHTGGNVNKSGKLGKMFGLDECSSNDLAPSKLPPHPSSSSRSLPLYPTGLFISGPLHRSDQLDHSTPVSTSTKSLSLFLAMVWVLFVIMLSIILVFRPVAMIFVGLGAILLLWKSALSNTHLYGRHLVLEREKEGDEESGFQNPTKGSKKRKQIAILDEASMKLQRI